MSPSKILLYFSLSFILGIFLNSIIQISLLSLLGFFILGIFLIAVFWRFEKVVVVGFCLIFLVAGIWRHQLSESRAMNDELSKYNDREKIVTLIGVIITEPDVRERSQKLEVSTQLLNEAEINGKLLVTAGRYPEFQYGDKLKITGKLETPVVFEGFNYKDYLKKDGIYSVMYFPEIELLEKGLGNPLMSILFSFKGKFQKAIQSFISPPQGGILEALVFGEEDNISQEWKDKLNLTGTRHITAVSGMNTTIIGFLILSFALSLGLWRQQAFYLSIFILLLYILMIGAPSSAIRAGIMAAILMTAQYFGRLSSATRAVVVAAAIMLLFNPLLLRLDVGFQLSFLAILGIVHLQPTFFLYLKKVPNLRLFPMRTTLSATLAAQIFTLPILIDNFGRIPLLSPITNVLIIPFLAPLTILLFTFGITAMIFRPLGFLLSFPSWLSLTYITEIVDIFSKIPFVSLALENVHWIWLLISYLILGYLTWWLNKKSRFLPVP